MVKASQFASSATTRRGQQVIAGDYLSAIRDFALGQGINASTLLEGSSLELGHLLNPPEFVDAQCMVPIGGNLVESLESPHEAAIRFGRSMALRTHGALGLAIQGAENLAQVAEMLNQFIATRSTFNELSVLSDKNDIHLCIRELPLREGARDENIQDFFNLATIASIEFNMRQLLIDYPEDHSLAINLCCSEPEGFPHDLLSPHKVYFNKKENSICIPSEWASMRLKSASPELAKAALAHCEAELRAIGGGSMLENVRKLLMVAQGESPSLEEVAAFFHMSPSSLQRRLKEQDSSYRAIKADVLNERAQKYLQTTGWSTDRIAETLGFSDASNFSKSFRNWNGMTPAEYRSNQ